jgi:hypothetical protein
MTFTDISASYRLCARMEREEHYWQDAEKVALLTLPTLARRDAPIPMHRSRIAQILIVSIEILGGRKYRRGFSVLQDSLYRRTAPRSAVGTSSGLHSLWSCWTAFLSVLLKLFPVMRHMQAIEVLLS